MDDSETKAKLAEALKRLFSAFPTTARDDPAYAAQTYMMALADHSLDAVQRSVEQFVTGKVEDHDGRFAPSVAQLTRNVRLWESALATVRREEPTLYTGLLEVDFGDGKINLRGMTAEQQDAVLRNKGIPAQIAAGVTPKFRKLGYTVGDERND